MSTSTYPSQPSSSLPGPGPSRAHNNFKKGDEDHTDEEDANVNVDPDLRLRTVRTAASAIEESIETEQRMERRKKRRKRTRLFFTRKKEVEKPAASSSSKAGDGTAAPSTHVPGERRKVYVNWMPTPEELDSKGEPLVIYERNKVRTTKYTPLTFIPKNLYEQFRRVANLFFLTLLVLQLFPIFGAANGSLAMIPLVFILTVTAIKDGVEDYRRSTLDEQVNTSAATKLGGGWRNVNQPTDPREWWQKLLGLGNKPGEATRGVKRLREKERERYGGEMGSLQGFQLRKVQSNGTDASVGNSIDLARGAGAGGRLEDIQSLDETTSSHFHSYPPTGGDLSKTSLSDSSTQLGMGGPPHLGAMAQQAAASRPSFMSALSASSTAGRVIPVIDPYTPPPPSSYTASWERTLWKKLEVGDIVLLRDNDQVPADIVVLSTSDPDGLCYLETKNLDGETNLKVRKSVKPSMGLGGLGSGFSEGAGMGGNGRPGANGSNGGLGLGEEEVVRARFWLDSEPPHQNLYLYHGVLHYRDYSINNGGNGNNALAHPPNPNAPPPWQDKTEPVTINELLLRGCSIRNTTWIIGLVVFTGADTKIMLNGGATPSKRSKIEKETNFNVIVNFCLLTIMCTVAAVFSGVQDARVGTSAELFEAGSDPTGSVIINAVITFVSCLIAFQNIVPISLYISIEIVKTIQAYFISQDIDMYYAPYDTPCVPKTWNISDDLGQIEYVFSDKTGTLTQNVMELQKCSVNGVAYGEGVTEAQKGAALRGGKNSMQGNTGDNGNTGGPMDPEELDRRLVALKTQMLATMERTFKNRYAQPDQLTLISPKLAQDLQPASPQRAHLIAFFRALALCHSVLSDRPDADPLALARPRLEYKAESPDEAALVSAARDVGFPFVYKTKDYLEIEVMGQIERWAPLKMLEFNSTRKRMSVLFRSPDGRIVLFCKGADSVIYKRLAKEYDQDGGTDSKEKKKEEGKDVMAPPLLTPAQLKAKTAADMEVFANTGLRTLCIAYRYLSEQEYFTWVRRYDEAVAMTGESRDEEIDKAQEEVERELKILGATALEDKLQEGVPEAIEMLHRAGIKLWILTGDKLQTAIEIGYSCNLLKPEMELMILSADTPANARLQIEGGLNKIASIRGPPPNKRWSMKSGTGTGTGSEVANLTGGGAAAAVAGAGMGKKKASFAVVIDGDTLRYALAEDLKPLFLNLGTQCETVVCCRVSPAQKALTVKLVKEGRNAMTLSIGDGANDVAMIQEANIGCGLFGLEGSQAAMSADYAFGQFRFLTKLLLVHGRWSYQRVADMHSNFFYKNVIWTFAMFWFLPFNSFEATYLYQYTFILLCNLLFTSLPVINMGAFDQDINAKAALAYPQLYMRGILGLEYTRGKFWMYMCDGLYQSAVVFFIPYLVWTLSLSITWNGKTLDSLSDFGTTVAVAAIFAANSYVGLNMNYWTVITWVVVFGSSVLMLTWIVVYSFLPSADFVDEVVILFGNITFWSTVFFSVLVALAPRFIIKFWTTVYSPLDKDIVREMWVQGSLKDELGIRHRSNKRNLNASSYTDDRMLEAAPMFSEQHSRSLSELHGGPGGYEPTLTMSPHDSSQTPRPTYIHTPIPPPEAREYGRELASQPQQPSQQHLLPNVAQRRMSRQANSPGIPDSPHVSVYSASDLPPPSPLPLAQYKMPNGELTTTPPPPSRRGSVATSLGRGGGNSRYGDDTPMSPPLPTPSMVGYGNPGEYEMRVRSPPNETERSLPPPHQQQQQPQPPALHFQQHLEPIYGHHGERTASSASYMTASDDLADDVEDLQQGQYATIPSQAQYQPQQQPYSPASLQSNNPYASYQQPASPTRQQYDQSYYSQYQQPPQQQQQQQQMTAYPAYQYQQQQQQQNQQKRSSRQGAGDGWDGGFAM